MVLKHLQAALALYLASAAALAALQAGAQEGGPPGSEAPGEMEGEVETVIVIGTNEYRCPNGARRAVLEECPGFVRSWYHRIFYAYWDRKEHTIMDFPSGAPTSGSTPDANCKCVEGKVKVYDDNDDTFHCKPAPPDAGCPEWGNTFNFEPSVWKCVPEPAGKYMGKIKDCLPPGNIPAVYWANVPYFRWNNNLKNAKGEPVLGTTYVSGSSIVGIEFNYSNMVASAPGASMSVTDAANLMIHDELIHVRDVVEYGGPKAWEKTGIEVEMERAGYWGRRPFTKAQYEEFTFSRALGETGSREKGGAGMKPAAGCLGKW